MTKVSIKIMFEIRQILNRSTFPLMISVRKKNSPFWIAANLEPSSENGAWCKWDLQISGENLCPQFGKSPDLRPSGAHSYLVHQKMKIETKLERWADCKILIALNLVSNHRQKLISGIFYYDDGLTQGLKLLIFCNLPIVRVLSLFWSSDEQNSNDGQIAKY
jgi:hypothetical protein